MGTTFPSIVWVNSMYCTHSKLCPPFCWLDLATSMGTGYNWIRVISPVFTPPFLLAINKKLRFVSVVRHVRLFYSVTGCILSVSIPFSSNENSVFWFRFHTCKYCWENEEDAVRESECYSREIVVKLFCKDGLHCVQKAAPHPTFLFERL